MFILDQLANYYWPTTFCEGYTQLYDSPYHQVNPVVEILYICLISKNNDVLGMSVFFKKLYKEWNISRKTIQIPVLQMWTMSNLHVNFGIWWSERHDTSA